MQTTSIQENTLDEAAQVLALASVHLKKHPEWSLPLIEIVTGRLCGESDKKKRIFPVLEKFLATSDVGDGALDVLDDEIAALRAQWGEYLRSARDIRFNEGDIQGALAMCEKLSMQALSNREDTLMFAHICAQAGQLDNAKLLADSVSDRDVDGELQRFRSSIFERLGQFDEALCAAQSALLLLGNNSAVKADLERILAKRLDQLIALRDNSPETHEGLAAATELVRLDSSGDNIAALAHVQARQGALGGALESVDRVLALEPSNGEHFRLKASLLERMGLLEKALPVAAKAIELLPNEALVEEDYRRIFAARRDELIRLRDENFPNILSLEAAGLLDQLGHSTTEDIAKFAHIQTHHGLLEQALITIEKAIKRDVSDSEFYRLKCSLLERLGMFDAGLVSIKQGLKLAPRDRSLKTDMRRLRAKVICSRILRA